MLAASPVSKERGAHYRRRPAGVFLLLALCGSLNCTSSVKENSPLQIPGLNQEERTPTIKYDEQGRIKGLFGLRTHPSADPTCRMKDYTVDFVNIERGEYLVFQLPSTFRVWVKIEGEMQRILSDPHNTQAREFLSKQKKYKLMAYACDAIGHTSYETVSVELLD